MPHPWQLCLPTREETRCVAYGFRFRLEGAYHPFMEIESAFSVGGMDCASCVAHVEKAARKVAGVAACQVNLARGRAVVTFDPSQTSPAKVAAAITDSGYTAEPEDESLSTENAEELIEDLTLSYNKVRQANITREMIEIASGANAR